MSDKCECNVPVVVNGSCVNCFKEVPHVAFCRCDCIVPTYPLFRSNKHVFPCQYADKEAS